MDPRTKDESSMIYEAGVVITEDLKKVPKGLQSTKIPAGRYAQFTLIGPYHLVWPAFEQIFKILGDLKIELRKGPCIENYLNDPKITPEDKLVTQLLIPVK